MTKQEQIFHCIVPQPFIHSFVDEHLGCPNPNLDPVIQSEEEKGEELGFPPILPFKFYSSGLEHLHLTALAPLLLYETH